MLCIVIRVVTKQFSEKNLFDVNVKVFYKILFYWNGSFSVSERLIARFIDVIDVINGVKIF